MKAPFCMVTDGTWYNPGDDVKEEHENYFFIEAKRRKMQTDEWTKERLKRQTVSADINNTFRKQNS